MNKKTIRDISVAGKRVLVRVDFNVPLQTTNGGEVTVVSDDTRIRAALPTLNYLLENGAGLILCSHLGRPQSASDRKFVMDPIGERLGELLGRPVTKLDDLVGEEVTAAAGALQPGEVLLLENTRFHPGEKKNDPDLSAQLAALADAYVNDAFGTAHRAHASTEGVARAMRARGGESAAGYLMKRELDALSVALEDPPHPYVAIMGGAKISDKAPLVERLLQVADKVLVGGGMANTFVKASGFEVGRSLVEEEAVPIARRLLETAGDRIILPMDAVIADDLEASSQPTNVPLNEVPAGKMILDIGLVSIQRFNTELQGAKLVLWNGPMGVFEDPRYASGTQALATLLAGLAAQGAQIIVGGGDSAAAVTQAGLVDQMSHVSTGGGASLAFLQGETLPAVAALDDRPPA